MLSHPYRKANGSLAYDWNMILFFLNFVTDASTQLVRFHVYCLVFQDLLRETFLIIVQLFNTILQINPYIPVCISCYTI